MIMQGKTPRSLSRAGVVTVLGLGLLLLPLLRVSGQVPPPPAEPAADKGTTDRLVQELEKAVRALKEQQRADQQRRAAEPDAKSAPPAPTPAAQPELRVTEQALSQFRRAREAEATGADDLRKAEAEAEAAGREVKAKEDELQEARARFNAAAERVKKLRAEHSARVAPPAGKRPPPAGPDADRLNELEQKLQRVLEEVQDLRKELHRERSSVPPPPAAPLPPARVPPPATTPPPAGR